MEPHNFMHILHVLIQGNLLQVLFATKVAGIVYICMS